MQDWQSVELESANFLKFYNHILAYFGAPIGKQLAIRAGLCEFAAGQPSLPGLPSIGDALCFQLSLCGDCS